MSHVYKDMFPEDVTLVQNHDPLEISRKLALLAERSLRSRVHPARIGVAIRAFEAQLKAIALAAAIRQIKEGEDTPPIVFDSQDDGGDRIRIIETDEEDATIYPERDLGIIRQLEKDTERDREYKAPVPKAVQRKQNREAEEEEDRDSFEQASKRMALKLKQMSQGMG